MTNQPINRQLPVSLVLLVPTLSGGGAERVAALLASYMPSDQFVPLVVVYESTIAYPCRARIVSLQLPAGRGLIGKTLRMLRAYFRFRKILKSERPDLVLSFMDGPNLVNLLTAGPKAIVSIHNNPSIAANSMTEFADKLIFRFVQRHAGHMIVVSEGIRQHLLASRNPPKGHLHAIPNPVDVTAIDSLSKRKMPNDIEEFCDGMPFLVTMGRLCEQKAQWVILRALSHLQATHKGIRLVILGEGQLELELRELTSLLGLEQWVMFAGFRKNPYSILARAQLFVSTSLWEGMPLVLLESLACNLPVLATDCLYGPREILQPDSKDLTTQITNHAEWTPCGALVPVSRRIWRGAIEPLSTKESVLVETLKILLDDEQKLECLRSNCRSTVEQSFGIEKISRSYAKYLKSIA